MQITVDAINQELAGIIAALTDAAASRDKGISIDLTPLTIQATKLCEHIINLSPEDAAQILPDLQRAVDTLNAIHESVKQS